MYWGTPPNPRQGGPCTPWKGVRVELGDTPKPPGRGVPLPTPAWFPFQSNAGCGKPLEMPIDTGGHWPYTTLTADVLSVCRDRIPKGPKGSFGILL